jgi:hypothetical protein
MLMTTLEDAWRHAARVSGVSTDAHDLMIVLTNGLEGITAIKEYKRDAGAAGGEAVLAALRQVEQRMCEDVVQFRDLVVQRLPGGTQFTAELRDLAGGEVIG